MALLLLNQLYIFLETCREMFSVYGRTYLEPDDMRELELARQRTKDVMSIILIWKTPVLT